MNAIIIEDEIPVSETLKLLLQKYCPSVSLQAVARSFNEAYKLCRELKPELLFCDIQLNSEEGTGLDLVQLINDKNMKVIFITGNKEFAVDAFRVNATDYLLKPINIKELVLAVEKAKEKILSETAQLKTIGNIHIPTQHGFLIMPLQDIVRCQAEGPYTHFFCSNKYGKKTSSVNLGLIEERLPADHFFRVHKTHIINRSHILEYVRGEGGMARMSDNSEVPISRMIKEAFMKWLG